MSWLLSTPYLVGSRHRNFSTLRVLHLGTSINQRLRSLVVLAVLTLAGFSAHDTRLETIAVFLQTLGLLAVTRRSLLLEGIHVFPLHFLDCLGPEVFVLNCIATGLAPAIVRAVGLGSEAFAVLLEALGLFTVASLVGTPSSPIHGGRGRHRSALSGRRWCLAAGSLASRPS